VRRRNKKFPPNPGPAWGKPAQGFVIFGVVKRSLSASVTVTDDGLVDTH
jgi:hypothetical protein